MDASGFALDRLAPTGEDYPMLPIDAAITWSDCAASEAAAEFYLVVFRSIRRAGVDEVALGAHDDAAHEEAIAAPGFVHYFKGPLSPERACLSFCLWTSRVAAREASGLPAHRAAVAFIADAYDHFTLEFYRARKDSGSLRWSFEPYDRAPAGSDEVARAA
jgi:hypothetical protein